jgi:hypothetical protein
MIASSPILSHSILRTGDGRLSACEQCLRAVVSGDFSVADARIAFIAPTAPHLRVFSELVGILVAVYKGNEVGLLGIDWKRIQKAGQSLLSSELPIATHRPWLETLVRWAITVQGDTAATGGRQQLDILTIRARDPDIQELLLFAMSSYLNRVRGLGPAARVRAIVGLPESILQALAASHCGIDFRQAPATFPQLDYSRFFSGQKEFRLPEPGTKMELTSLLVIVPAVLAGSCGQDSRLRALSDPVCIRPLHQKLVDRLRNAAAHTYADFSEPEADFLVDLCAKWLEGMAILAGYDGTSGLPVLTRAPTMESLSMLLYGAEEL